MKIHYVSLLIVGCVGTHYVDSNVGSDIAVDYAVSKGIGSSKNLGTVSPKNNIRTEQVNNDRITSNYYGIYSNIGDYIEKYNAEIVGNLKKDNLFNAEVNGINEKEDGGNKIALDFDEGNPDINATIVRPCEIYDTFCIRRFLSRHSRCKISSGPVPDPLYRAQLVVNYPRVNITAIQNNVEYRGLNTGRVEEFYYNKKTDNLVIAIGFDFVSIFSNTTYLKFYLKGREPIVTMDFGGLRYEQISVTVVIPRINDLRLDKAEMYTYIGVPVYSFVVGPGLTASSDPAVPLMVAAFIADLRTNSAEALLTEGPFYAATFIQKSICDFGLTNL